MAKRNKKKSKNKKTIIRHIRKNCKRSVVHRYNKNRSSLETTFKEVEQLVNELERKKKELEKKENHNFKMIVLFSLFLIFLIGFTVLFLNYPFISILGNKTIELEYHTTYVDDGAKGIQFFRDITSFIQVTNNVNTDKIGEYSVIYSYSYLGFSIQKKRIVKVVDTDYPNITLTGDPEINICPEAVYEEEGFKAYDAYDGDLTNKVVRIEEEEEIYYIVKDSSGNFFQTTRKIWKVDDEDPKIQLTGDSIINMTKGSQYQELGFQATDNCDGDLTSKVKIQNLVDANTPGTYQVQYSVTDSSGNFTLVIRTVIVKEPSSDEKGVIYLTFDDGPSNSITPKLLDILKEEEVSATFFVIGTSSSFDSLVKREYQEGHTVALHSYTHQYNMVYPSVDAYFQDLNQIRNKVYQSIGEYVNIIRFPGGSSNTISKKYSVGIMTTLTNQVTQKGYHYFDWNVSSEDAGGVSSSEEVYRNVVDHLSLNRSNVVLMHDFENNYYTLNAIRDIIHYGKENGYTFAKITMDTKEVHHSVAN